MFARAVVIASACLLSTGCYVTQLEVTNPVPGLSKVAIAPFFDLSHERAVDGRRFALAYFTELQKTPGFQVLPVGIAERAIHDYGLQMNDPADAMRLAQILEVDAVVVGAVTDYDPYYPPRIGLQVAWYSPRQWPFFPGVATDPQARRELREQQVQFEEAQKDLRKAKKRALRQAKSEGQPCPEGCEDVEEDKGKLRVPYPWYVRGQSPDEPVAPPSPRWVDFGPAEGNVVEMAAPPSLSVPTLGAPVQLSAPPQPEVQLPVPPLPSQPEQDDAPTTIIKPAEPELPRSDYPRAEVDTPSNTDSPSDSDAARDASPARPTIPVLMPQTSLPPMMSYTRMFDGADADLVAALRDYVELSGDRRSGGWEGYLHRSEDFIRFTAHRMIVEMLMLHGGEGRRRIVLKHRKVR